MTRGQLCSTYPEIVIKVHQGDISIEEDVQRMIEDCVKAFGRVDYALNVAGVVPSRTPHTEVDVSTYDRVVGVNEYGVSFTDLPGIDTNKAKTWLCQRAQIKQMMRQDPLPGYSNIRGSITSVSSLAGLNASSGMSTYSASKASIIGFAKTDAQDYGPHGIRINVVCPGMIDTELFRQTSPKEAPQKLAAITPVRRLGRPEDIGLLLAFLSSSKASFIQGTAIPCDGGLSLQRGVI